MLINANFSCQKMPSKFLCKICDFTCSKKSNYDVHLMTLKHQNANLCYQNVKKNAKPFSCEICDAGFKHMSSLSRHKKKCQTKEHNLVDLLVEQNLKLSHETMELKEIIVEQNKEFKEIVLDVCKQMKPTTITNNNCNNKTFNLNVFLNETCKDAMNIMDFVDSLNLQLSDLESIGKLGYIEGISNIIVKNLKAMDVNKRPVHCSDSKREVVYIKDDNKWEKENQEKTKLRKVIKRVANKNSRLLPKFKELHPDCWKSDSKYADYYNKLIIEAMGGPGDNDTEKEDKIIKKITKEVIINKDEF